MTDFLKRTWAEVCVGSIENNYKKIKENLPAGTKICCVVKADAYGHGAETVAPCLEKLGADFFAVSNIDEALALRKADVKAPVLILGYTPARYAKVLAENDLSQCVYSSEYADQLASQAALVGVKVKIHIKIDTGMGRLGFVFRSMGEINDENIGEIEKVCSHKSFIREGIFTHFAKAENKEFTKEQFRLFSEVITLLEKKKIDFSVKHCSNSAAAILYPQYGMDMVRLGIALYGANPVPDTDCKISLQPALALKTAVTNIKTVKKGETISYGGDYTAERDMKVATLSIGYADGFHRRNYTNGFKIRINGTPCPITGRICMDQTMIDVSKIENLKTGDEVTLFGKDCDVSLEEFAKINETITYEVLCSIGARVPRRYVKE